MEVQPNQFCEKRINVARDFSRFPGGRYLSDGPSSGERFRNDFLLPALAECRVVVLLDGPLGYGSGFLEEAFGGLVREGGWSLSDLEAQLILQTEDATLHRQIWGYICEASSCSSK